MRYKSFRIRNFKGIKDTTIHLESITGASVFAFVGLNESGKTTILEAIHSFSPDSATSELLGRNNNAKSRFADYVPRHLISTFTGNISVSATISATYEERQQIRKIVLGKGLDIDIDSLPPEFVIEIRQEFKDGDFQEDILEMITPIRIKSRRAKNWRHPSDEEKHDISGHVYNLTPDIAYFPTFIFDFPKSIFLTDRGNVVDRFYRRVFQDILDYDRQGHTIEKDIVRRIRATPMVVPWLSFFSLWNQHDDKTKIQHVMDRAGAAVTRLVLGRWNQIFGEDARGKEVLISFDTLEGEKIETNGNKTKTLEHDISIKFQIRDGTRRFNINDRSLGFRWFFAFMLFTQFRVARSVSRPLLFLFDEPASNLHAAAQQKLIDCFPGIAQGKHMLAYTTHSHYMIEPKWLEQTFIVTNRTDAPLSSMLDDISLDDESLDIKARSYRSFVNDHPNQTSYFQPILDRLEVIPSRFDLKKASVVIEGKSDYYILRYAAQVSDFADFHLLPAFGATTFGALAALNVGWNLDFLFVLDGDVEGETAKNRYAKDYGIPLDRIVTIAELDTDLSVIEDVVDDKALEFIQSTLGISGKPSKNQIRRFFQERLASAKIDNLSDEFLNRSKTLLQSIKDKIG